MLMSGKRGEGEGVSRQGARGRDGGGIKKVREKWWRGEKARESPDRELEDEMEEGLRKCERSGGEGRRRGSLQTGS